MPEADKFLRGFNLVQGTRFGQYTLSSAISTHRSIKRYREYAYDITLQFHPDTTVTPTNYKELYNQLVNKISQPQIIYGIRNPYRCLIDIPPEDNFSSIHLDELGNVVFHLLGHAYRT